MAVAGGLQVGADADQAVAAFDDAAVVAAVHPAQAQRVAYQKEIQFGGEIHNGILVVQNFFNWDRDRALCLVADLMCSGMYQFRHVVATELFAMFDNVGLDRDVRDGLLCACRPV